MYPAVYYRLTALALLLGLLSGCSVYDHFFHPHRLGTPSMTASAKAKAKAAEKARHKGLTLGSSETPGDAAPSSADGAAVAAPDTRSADDKNKAIAEMLGNTYDKKTGLLKRNKLQRMQYSRRALHHYDLSAPGHTDVAHDERKLRKYARHPKASAPADELAPRASPRAPAPAADPAPAAKAAAQPATPPTAAEPPAAATDPDEPPLASRPKPGKFQAEKKSKKRDRKAPRPDPTQPDGN